MTRSRFRFLPLFLSPIHLRPAHHHLDGLTHRIFITLLHSSSIILSWSCIYLHVLSHTFIFLSLSLVPSSVSASLFYQYEHNHPCLMHSKPNRNAPSRQRRNKQTNLSYSDDFLSSNEPTHITTPIDDEAEADPSPDLSHLYSQWSEDGHHHRMADLLLHDEDIEEPQSSASTHHVLGDPTLCEGPVHVKSTGHSPQPADTHLPTGIIDSQPSDVTDDRTLGHSRPPVLTR